MTKEQVINLISILQQIQNDCGDNLDRSGQYTSDRIGDVLNYINDMLDEDCK